MAFIFVPGHARIKGNEKADNLANRAFVVGAGKCIALSLMVLGIHIEMRFRVASCIIHLGISSRTRSDSG